MFLDLDGVLANFSESACQVCDVPYPSNTIFTDTWLDEQCGKKLWNLCRGHDFWLNIQPFPWAQELRDLIANHTDQWIFLTKSSFDAGYYSGKWEWMKRHFPKDLARLWIVNGDKSIVCRGPGDLLIDDKSKNCQPWIEAGGEIYHWRELTPDYNREEVLCRLGHVFFTLKGLLLDDDIS